MVRPRPRTRWTEWNTGALGALCVGVLLGACGSNQPSADGNTVATGVDASSLSCAGQTFQGCPCSGDGTTANCGSVVSQNDGYVSCSEGTRACTGGIWGPCVAQYNALKSTGPIGGDLQTLGLSQPSAGAGPCATNPCDPNCEGFVDNSFGVDGGPGLVATPDGGWTLSLTGGTACTGLECQVPTCEAGKTTTVTGTVYDPAALNPVFNALVMISNGPVTAVSAGVSSDPCGGAPLPQPVTYAYSGTSGAFTLTNVPVGTSVPLVIQIGRWRRVTTIDTGTLACGQTQNVSGGCNGLDNYAGTANCATRLPRTQSEGNIPHIAIGTGGLDAMECVLYRMGVSSSEYTDELHSGRISLFNNGGSVLAPPNVNHDISYLLGFSCPTGQCPANPSVTTGIDNPSFETGGFTGWTTTGSNEQVSDWWSTQGEESALLGTGQWEGECDYSGTSSITQSGMTAPPGVTSVSVDEFELCVGNPNYVNVSLTDTTAGGTTQSCQDCQFEVTETCTLPVTPGHKYSLTMTNYDLNGSGYCTESFFDNVRWNTNLAVPSLLNNYDSRPFAVRRRFRIRLGELGRLVRRSRAAEPRELHRRRRPSVHVPLGSRVDRTHVDRAAQRPVPRGGQLVRGWRRTLRRNRGPRHGLLRHVVSPRCEPRRLDERRDRKRRFDAGHSVALRRAFGDLRVRAVRVRLERQQPECAPEYARLGLRLLVRYARRRFGAVRPRDVHRHASGLRHAFRDVSRELPGPGHAATPAGGRGRVPALRLGRLCERHAGHASGADHLPLGDLHARLRRDLSERLASGLALLLLGGLDAEQLEHRVHRGDGRHGGAARHGVPGRASRHGVGTERLPRRTELLDVLRRRPSRSSARGGRPADAGAAGDGVSRLVAGDDDARSVD